MTHEQLESLIDAYHDGQLNESERREVDRHLAGCADCARQMARLSFLSTRVFRAAPPPPTPTDFFVTRVMAAVRASDATGVRPAFRWPALVFAALVLFVVGTVAKIEHGVADRQPSTRNLLLASAPDSGAWAAHDSEPVDSLLDMTSEEI
jgi:anti-sigma factor RsiW